MTRENEFRIHHFIFFTSIFVCLVFVYRIFTTAENYQDIVELKTYLAQNTFWIFVKNNVC